MSFDGHKKGRSLKLFGHTDTRQNLWEGSIIPTRDLTYDIGSTTSAWANIFAGSSLTTEACVGDSTYCASIDSGNPQIQFDSGDLMRYDRATNQWDIKLNGAPNPDLLVQNGVTRVRDKLEVGNSTACWEKLVTGPQSGDSTLSFGLAGGNVTSIEYDNAIPDLEFTVDGVRRVNISSEGILFDPLDGDQTPLGIYEEDFSALIDYSDSGGADNYQTGGGAVQGRLNLSRVGVVVNCRVQSISGTMTLASPIITPVGAIPARFRPPATFTLPILAIEAGIGGTAVPAMAEVTAAGTFIVYLSNFASFNAAATDIGLFNGSLSWSTTGF